MVHGCTLLLVTVRFHLFVSSLDTVKRVHALTVLLGISGEVALKNASAATSFLLADVSIVGVTEQENAAHEQSKVTLALIVERVRLVPVWELSHILVGKRCLFTND